MFTYNYCLLPLARRFTAASFVGRAKHTSVLYWRQSTFYDDMVSLHWRHNQVVNFDWNLHILLDRMQTRTEKVKTRDQTYRRRHSRNTQKVMGDQKEGKYESRLHRPREHGVTYCTQLN